MEEYIDEGDDSPQEKLEKQRAKEKAAEAKGGVFSRVSGLLNPVAAALGPVQSILAGIVPQVRKVRYLLFWSDRILTLWLVIALLAVSVVLALIPWGFVIHWIMRLLGLVVLGPHMHFVGKKIDEHRLEMREREMEYRAADKKRKAFIIETYREAEKAKADEVIKKAKEEMEKASEVEKQRMHYMTDHAQYVFLNGNNPGNANVKFVAAADLTRSSATALNPALWEESSSAKTASASVAASSTTPAGKRAAMEMV